MINCLKPYHVNDPKIQNHKIPVPCGKCPPCLKRRSSQWSFRLKCEGRNHLLSTFVTLTYNDENLPKTSLGNVTLNKHDVQKFFKRLRKINEKVYKIDRKIVYYLAGEYGGTFGRPHYHCIIFNAHPNAIMDAWKLNDLPLGFVHLGNVNPASVGYSLKYIHKGTGNKFFKKDIEKKREFQLASKGIGFSYLSEEILKWHKASPSERCYVVIEDGKKISLPRYFRDKIFNDEEKKLIAIKMRDLAIEKEWQLFEIHGNNLESFLHQNAIEQTRLFNHKQKFKLDKL